MPADLVTATRLDAPLEALDPAEPSIAPLRGRRDWRPWIGAAISLALLAGAIVQLGKAPAATFAELMRLGPEFWGLFALLYLAQPFSELAIFGRLWRLPVSGLRVLLRKGVINEIVLGYSGEAYFYLWARRATGLTNAPFAAIKDVNILSALTGNALTLGMLGVSATALARVDLNRLLGPTLWSGVAVVAVSLGILLFRRRVFSLDRKALIFVGQVTAGRVLATTALTVLMWRVALPDVALGVWIVLASLRLLISRLPLLTNKDLVFANLAFVVGVPTDVSLLVATLAVATLVAHLAVIGSLGGWDLLRRARDR